MFGLIDPEFCAALARVVMLGALLEDRLWTLLTQLKMPTLDCFATRVFRPPRSTPEQMLPLLPCWRARGRG